MEAIVTKIYKNSKNYKNYFIIQYLRKSKLGDEYLAGYLNMILKSLLNNGGKFYFQINIRGGCWSKTLNTATALVNKVFNGVYNLSKTQIWLDNQYPRFNRFPTIQAILSDKFRFNPKHIRWGTNEPDHSKEIFIECNGDPVFYLVGSSNFSKNTYMTQDRNINQTDVAFIKYSDSTKYLISSIVEKNANDNILLKNFANELNELNNLNDEDETIDYYSPYIENIKPYIITAPYIGSDHIIKREES